MLGEGDIGEDEGVALDVEGSLHGCYDQRCISHIMACPSIGKNYQLLERLLLNLLNAVLDI